MEKNDGGPAYPAKNYIVPHDLEQRHISELGATQGMSLRDYFAAAAMSYLVKYESPEMVAKNSYVQADAMLAAREAK